jgi:hypothetical protein
MNDEASSLFLRYSALLLGGAEIYMCKLRVSALQLAF